MATHLSTDEQVVVESHRAINKARAAHGLAPTPYLIPGVPTCSRKCIVAGALGIRNRVDGLTVAVRSKRSADRLAEAWDTSYMRVGHDYFGNKDFTWQVDLPRELTELTRRFDEKREDSIFAHCCTV